MVKIKIDPLTYLSTIYGKETAQSILDAGYTFTFGMFGVTVTMPNVSGEKSGHNIYVNVGVSTLNLAAGKVDPGTVKIARFKLTSKVFSKFLDVDEKTLVKDIQKPFLKLNT